MIHNEEQDINDDWNQGFNIIEIALIVLASIVLLLLFYSLNLIFNNP